MSALTKLSALLLLSITIFSPLCYSDTTTPKIGIITDLSGKFASWGTTSIKGAELAKRELKAQGVNVEIIIEDCSLDSMKAVTAAQKLITIDKVDALYVEATPPSVAVSPIAAKHSTPMFYIALAESPLKTNPLAFKSYVEATTGCEKIAKHWQTLGVKRVGILKAAAEYGELCREGVLRIFPDAKIADYNPNEDLLSQAMVLKKAEVEAIFNIGYEPDAINMFKVFKRLKMMPYIAVSDVSMTKNTISQTTNEQLDKTYTYGLYNIEKQFVDRLKALENSSAIEQKHAVAAAYSYVHIPHLVRALQKCPKKERQCLINSLLNEDKNPLTGFQAWTTEQRAINSLYLYRWSNGQPNIITLSQD